MRAAELIGGAVAVVVLAQLARSWWLPDTSCRWCRKHPGKRWGSTRYRSGPCLFCGGEPTKSRRRR